MAEWRSWIVSSLASPLARENTSTERKDVTRASNAAVHEYIIVGKEGHASLKRLKLI
jgi:hypothetical protein